MIVIDFNMFIVIVASFSISVPVFIILKKTILKNDKPEQNPGPTPKRLLAFVIILLSFIIPATILYHFLINSVWW